MAAQIRPGRCRNQDSHSALRARYPDDLEPGDYWRAPNGRWICYTPAPERRFLMLPPSEVTAHADGTLTAEPAGSKWRLVKGRWCADDVDAEGEAA